MFLPDALDKVLRSFERYYNIERENPTVPFAAEAAFFTHDEQYFLIRAARISQSDSGEYVFFALEENLDADTFERLDKAAWETGMSRTVPGPGHKQTDVALVILTNRISPDCIRLIRSRSHSRSYRFGLRGWSNYRLVVIEAEAGRAVHNRLGADLAKLLGNIGNKE